MIIMEPLSHFHLHVANTAGDGASHIIGPQSLFLASANGSTWATKAYISLLPPAQNYIYIVISQPGDGKTWP